VDPTTRVPLGRTDLRVTRLGLGTVPIAGLYEPVSEEQAQATLHSAYGQGVRYFATAPLYGYGVAEQRLGHFLADVPRPEVVVATKVGRLLQHERPGDEPSHRGPLRDRQFKSGSELEPVFDFSYDGALRSLEASLERLGTDRVDVLLIHDPDDHYDEAHDGAYVALEKLRGEGVVSAIGAGMNQPQMLARFARETDMNCFLMAGRYTLLDQSALVELLPLCQARGISIIIGGVFNSGILANPRGHATYNYQPAERSIVERALRIEAVCERHGVPIAAAAVQFPLGHPAVATVLTGVRSPAEIEANAQLFQHPIPDALWAELKAEGLLPAAAPTPPGNPS
jgi:D-threo-aldose 1-dehydrogenase